MRHGLRISVAVAVLVLLALPAAAAAHVTVVPSFLTDGRRSTLVFSSPNERPPHALVEVTVTLPGGIDLAAVSPPPGWRLELGGHTATWRGGRTGPGETTEFRLAATTRAAPAGLTLHAVQRYDDGGTVRWTVPFTILPETKAPKQHLWPALLAAAVGVVVIGAGLVWLHRRRPLPREEA